MRLNNQFLCWINLVVLDQFCVSENLCHLIKCSIGISGAGPDGVEEIKRHSFFSTIDWNVSVLRKGLVCLFQCQIWRYIESINIYTIHLYILKVNRIFMLMALAQFPFYENIFCSRNYSGGKFILPLSQPSGGQTTHCTLIQSSPPKPHEVSEVLF